jgi:hypothetical protein
MREPLNFEVKPRQRFVAWAARHQDAMRFARKVDVCISLSENWETADRLKFEGLRAPVVELRAGEEVAAQASGQAAHFAAR